MEWMKHGLEVPAHPLDDSKFWRSLGELNSSALSDAERKKRTVDALCSYLSLPLDIQAPELIEQMYARFRNCIRRATGNLQKYFEDILVEDLFQRVMPSPFIRHTADPELLIDCMVTQAGKDKRLYFEARRALYFGALFFGYEATLGNVEQLEAELAGIDRFFEAQFSFGEDKNTRIYHKIRERGDSGLLEGYAIRVPLFDIDRKYDEKTRLKFENYFPVTFRSLTVPEVSYDKPQTYCMYDSRVKTEFSAALKATRKRVPISSLKDCLGVKLYLYPGYEDAFDDVVETLKSVLPIEPGDRLIHPDRKLSPTGDIKEADNAFSSVHFRMEKMIAFWDPATIFSKNSKERESIKKILPFSLQRNRDAFFEEQLTLRNMQVEIQIGLLEDFINSHLVGSDENHRFYEVHRATESARGDAVPTLDALLPLEIFGIKFSDSVIIQALVQKQRSQLGVHHQALERVSRGL